MISVDLMSLWNAVYSVLLCKSVRNRTLESRVRSFIFHEGHFFLSQNTQIKQNLFAHCFDPTERLRHTEFTEASPPAPLRMKRGVVCEVTPIGLVIGGDGLLSIRRTWRGISVITPFSIRRGVGGEASVGCNVL